MSNYFIFIYLVFLFCFCLLFKFDCNKLNLSRFLSLGFATAFSSTIIIRYAAFESYQEGLNYFANHQKFMWVNTSLYLGGILVIVTLLFLSLDLQKKWLTSYIFIALSGLLVLFPMRFLSEVGLFTLSVLALFLLLLFSGTAWICMPTIIVGIIIIHRLANSSMKKSALTLITIALIAHLFLPWIYSHSLKSEGKSGFHAGYAEAVRTNLDIKSIHHWMAEQSCSDFEIYESMKFFKDNRNEYEEQFRKLPEVIRSMKPYYIFFSSSCGHKKDSRLTLGYKEWDVMWGLEFVYPPLSYKQLLKENKPYERRFFVADDCGCYVFDRG